MNRRVSLVLRSTGLHADVSDHKEDFMQFAVTAVAFAACVVSFSAQAAGAPNESFSRDMMTCAFKHITFAFGPGNASVAEKAAVGPSISNGSGSKNCSLRLRFENVSFLFYKILV